MIVSSSYTEGPPQADGWRWVRETHAGFEGSPLLTAEQKAAIRSGLEDFKEAKYIERPFRPDVLQLLSLYEAIGLLSKAQADAVRAAGNG